MIVPPGATHKHEAYGVVTFYAWRFLRYNSVSEVPCEPVYGWFSWNGNTWQRESCVNSTNFVRL